MDENAMFRVGDIVAARAEVSRIGPIIAELPPMGGSARYRVFHAPGQIRDYFVEELCSASSHHDHDASAPEVRRDQAAIDRFRAHLTAARLAHPLLDTVYALQAARIHHIPFQFKPILRLLRAERPRLLIADEVGVGKTIEAGLILKELQARQSLDNVLIVCPKPLVGKWRSEMRRFDEDFIPLTAESLRYCLEQADVEGAWPSQYARAIVHLELVRREEYLHGTRRSGRQRGRPGLLTLDPAPHFGLLIIDEAHHVRNPETDSHELARFLSEVSDAAIFLSATPVHLGAKNLFVLLHLLRPDLFTDMATFEQMIAPNRHITEALRQVRRAEAGWARATVAALDAAAATPWGARVISGDPRFTEWRDRLALEPTPDDVERVRCLRELEELHTLAHIMNRTRRRDIGRFTIREPYTVSAPFTPEQQRFYDALIAFRGAVLQRQHDPAIARLVADTLERQAASCLPAMIATIDSILATGSIAAGEAGDDDDSDVGGNVGIQPAQLARARELRAIAAALPPDDPKWDQLLGIVRDTMSGDTPGKVLVFSFFLRTLAYLLERLLATGVRAAVITGQIPDEEREDLRDRFRLPRADPDALDVLLSSEVGCEGLDYEFCDRLVNYDIPWNPMRLEQRIGRIDRFGQRADKVRIFNFITPGTVEERVFFRCYERLGIFHDTVGELDEILGELVQQLTRAALDPGLTSAQSEELARQTADNAVRVVDEQRRLEAEAGALLELDRAYIDEVDAVYEEGRFISTDDLRHMVAHFLGDPALHGELSRDDVTPQIVHLHLQADGRVELSRRIRALARQDRQAIQFRRWLDGEERSLAITFDRQTALERGDIVFVTPFHPLSRAAIAHWRAGGRGRLLTGRFRTRSSSLSAGRYLFVSEIWEARALRGGARLVSRAWDLERNVALSPGALDLSKMLEHASASLQGSDWLTEETEVALRSLEERVSADRQEALSALQVQNAMLGSRKLASVDAHFERRIALLRDELARNIHEKIARMKGAEFARVEREYRRGREEILARRDADIVAQRVAVGVLEVDNAD